MCQETSTQTGNTAAATPLLCYNLCKIREGSGVMLARADLKEKTSPAIYIPLGGGR